MGPEPTGIAHILNLMALLYGVRKQENGSRIWVEQ